MHWVTYYMNALCILKPTIFTTTLLALVYIRQVRPGTGDEWAARECGLLEAHVKCSRIWA